jgi:hypothetical protein
MNRKHLTAALLFFILTLMMTNPLVLHVWNAVEDKQDGLLNTWIVAWVGHALTTDPLRLFDANIFYPYPNTLAFSEILVPQSLFALPFTLATHNSIFGYNLALLAMLWLDAFAMYLLVLDWTRRAEAGWIAGVIYAFNPFNLGNFAQLQLLTLGWLPLLLLFLRKLLNSNERLTFDASRSLFPVIRFAFLFALFFILQSLSSFYYALLSGFAVALYLLWWFAAQRRALIKSIKRVALPVGAAFVLIALGLTPFLLPYFDVQRELGFSRRVQESEPFSAYLKQFSEVAPENVVYGKLLAPNPVVKIGGYPLDNLFPGVLALGLTVCGFILAKRAREKWFLILLLSVAFVLALGPRLYLTHSQATNLVLPYRWLYEIFPPMRALRAPVRFDALINFALAGLAGLGAAALLEKIAGARRDADAQRNVLGFSLVVVGLMALEYFSLPAAHTVTLPVASEIPNVYKWLAQQPPGVVLELPMMGPNANGELDISTQYFSTYHWQKTPDGYSGFVPSRRGEIAYEMQSFPSPRSMALLRALDVNLVIDHAPAQDCHVFSGPIGYIKPTNENKMDGACIYRMPSAPVAKPDLAKSIYVPSSVAAGAPFDAYLILVNHDVNAYGVKPTARVTAEAHWSDNRIETVSFPLPLVTSSVSVVPVRLTAPARAGDYEMSLQTLDPLIGATQVETNVHVGNENANQVVIPATVELREPLLKTVARGEILRAALRWLPHNKINAYYSASVRLVNVNGDKVANVDRQPIVPTLLWRPEEAVNDDFALTVPPDIPSGTYRVEVLMYQADTDTDALLLDKNFVPQPLLVLGELEVK